MEEEDYSGSEGQELSNQEEGSIADEFNFFESQLPSYPELLKHPVFELKEDPIFSIFIEAILPLIKAIPNKSGIEEAQKKIKEMLFSEIFGDKKIPELKKEYSVLGSPKTICGKLIGKEEIYFRCLDCDMHENNSFVSLLCIGCFEKSNHEGHRLIIVKKENNSSATCDCGDADVFNPDGFCPEHQPKEIDVEALLRKFPQDMLQKFQVTLQKALYASISFFEIAQRSGNKIVSEAVEILADQCLDEVLSLCVLCYSEINESFLHLIGHTLKSAFPSHYNKIWHDCDDNSAEKDPNTLDIENPHECKCLILVNLLRIGNVMSTEKQAKLHKILVECAKENHFKEFLVVEFTKYVQFLYSTDYVNDDYEDNSNSRLLNMKTQLYGRDSLMMTALNSGHFDNFLTMMRRVVNGAQDTNHGVYHILADLRSSILYFLNAKYKSAEILLKNTNLLNDVLGVLTLFQTRFVYQGRIHIGVFDHNVEYKKINSRLMIEKVLSQILEAGIRVICRYPKEEKTPLCKKLISEWQINFFLAKESLDDDIKHGAVSFNPGLERFFVSLLKCYLGSDVSLQAIHGFFKELLPADTKPNEVAEKVMEGVLRNLGMVRFLHMVHNFKSGPLWHVYYFFNNVFFEMDIVTVQMMSIMVRPEVLFELLTENFFSYSSELQDFFKNPEALKDSDYIKQKISVIEDFMNFLIYIMNDEICRLNLAIKDAHSFYEDLVLNANDKKVIERIIVNILLGQFWTDLPHVKNTLKDILKEQHEVDDVIPKITIGDEKNHKIRIKDEYESEFDPYLFYRAPAVQRDIFHSFNSKMKKDKPVDLVSGKRYLNQPEHLVAIQKGLFQSNLPNFLSLFFSKVLPLTTSFVRPALKLVLLNLQVVEDILKSNKNDAESDKLKTKVMECYLNSEFSNHLKSVLSDESLQDCEGCIGKIRDLIKTLRKQTDEENHKLNNKTSPGKNLEVPSQEEDKKNLARLKMQKLKEEFAKKQAKFAKSHSDVLEKTDTEESKIETESALTFSEHVATCQYCLDKIVEGTEEYGFPIYVALTNNFYDTEKAPEFEKFDSSRLAQTNFWPVISSCNHYYHKKCFVLLYKNSKKQSDSAKKHFSCVNESYCSLCKTLCNSFLCIGENQKGDMQEEPVDMNEAIYPNLFEPFTKQVDSIFKISMEKIAEMIHMEVSDEELELPTETLFLRAYTYFIEAFHLQEQAEMFEKDFNLYSMVFRKYVAHLKEKKIKLPQTRSFLSQVDLNTGQIIIPMDEVMKKQKTEQLQQYSSEDLLNNILFGVLDDMVPHESNIVDPTEVTNRQLSILKEYLVFKLIQSVSFAKGDTHLLFKDLKAFYNENTEFSSKFIKEIVFPFQKIMLSFALNHNILLNESPFDDLLSLLIHPKDDLEYLNRVLNETGILLSFDDILDQAIGDLLEGQKSEAEVLPLQILLSSKQSLITHNNSSPPRVVKYAPTSVKLPQNYAEFNTKYFRMKCSLCQGYSQHLLSSICLICGEFMCQAYCDPKNKKFGNLNRHAGEYHMGLGLFLDVQHLSKTVLSVPINAIYTGKNVYIDKLGQAIQVFLYERRSIISSLDFKKFVLNEEFLQNLKDIINHHSMGKEVFKIARTANYYYHNGNL